MENRFLIPTRQRRILSALLLAILLIGGCSPAPVIVEVTATPTATAIPPTATPTPQLPPTVDALSTPSSSALVLIGTLIDGTGSAPVPDAALVTEGETIVAVGPRDEVTIPPTPRSSNFPKPPFCRD
jgi:hypothetical protein